jgi:hypothetical protein
MEGLDEVPIYYVAHPCRYGIVMATTPGSADAEVMANVKP